MPCGPVVVIAHVPARRVSSLDGLEGGVKKFDGHFPEISGARGGREPYVPHFRWRISLLSPAGGVPHYDARLDVGLDAEASRWPIRVSVYGKDHRLFLPRHGRTDATETQHPSQQTASHTFLFRLHIIPIAPEYFLATTGRTRQTRSPQTLGAPWPPHRHGSPEGHPSVGAGSRRASGPPHADGAVVLESTNTSSRTGGKHRARRAL